MSSINKKKLAVALVIIIISGIILAYLAEEKTTSASNEKIGVIVSIGPQVEFVKAVGGDKVDVTLMVPATADVHTYEPLPDQLRKVKQASMYVPVGTPIEFETNYLERIIAINPDMLVVNASQGISLIPNSEEDSEEIMDAHVWTDPENAKIMVNNIYEGLVKVDPTNMEYYKRNRDEYLYKLDELDRNTTQLLKDNKKPILIFHPAFSYYAQAYNLTMIPAMFNDEEPSPQTIAMMVDVAQKNNIKIVYLEPQYDAKFMQTIANQIGGEILMVSDLDEHYLENMKNVAIAFSRS
jgi:zinc transport system substrate-binding protein